MSTVAAIDCGTNTIKLLVGDLPHVAVRETRIVRLGQGVDATGRLAEEALERAFAALDEYAVLIERHGATGIRFCATSATRDAANADVFTQGVRNRLGVVPEVLSGDEEARLSFEGAVRHLRRQPELPVLVIDIGGGSTELILGSSLTAPPDAAGSIDIGSVRMHERHLRSDPANDDEIAAATRDIDEHLDRCPVEPAPAATVVGVAGTVTSVAAGVLGLDGYSREAVDQAEVAVEDVHTMVERLLGMSVQERLELPWLHPGRADVIGAGALILSRTLRRTHVSRLVVSEADILEGIAWSMVS